MHGFLRGGAALAALATVFLVAGCTAPSTDPVAAVPAVAAEDPFTPPTVPVGIVATGELVSPDGLVSGSVEIRWDGEEYLAELVDYANSTQERLSLAFTDDLLAPGDCVWERYQINFEVDGNGDWYGPHDGRMPVGEVGDPTFLSTAVIVVYGPVAVEWPGCGERSLAWAALDWDLPTPSPGIVVIDGGEQAGAQGSVTLAGGQPSSYLTRQGDSLAAIAERFGISVDELQYLNPHRPWAAANRSLAYAEEELNLSQSSR